MVKGFGHKVADPEQPWLFMIAVLIIFLLTYFLPKDSTQGGAIIGFCGGVTTTVVLRRMLLEKRTRGLAAKRKTIAVVKSSSSESTDEIPALALSIWTRGPDRFEVSMHHLPEQLVGRRAAIILQEVAQTLDEDPEQQRRDKASLN